MTTIIDLTAAPADVATDTATATAAPGATDPATAAPDGPTGAVTATDTAAPPSAAPATLADILATLTGASDAWSWSDDEIRAWDERCRALDAAAAAAHAERCRDQLDGLAPPAAGGTWGGHLASLAREHGRHEFSVSAVRTAALAGAWTAPPGRWDPAAPEFTRRLGVAYAAVAGRVHGGMVLAPAGKSHGTRRWRVTDPAG